MPFRWKRLRCLLPIAIIFLICWLGYYVVTFSSPPAIDLNKIQDQLSFGDRSPEFKLKQTNNRKASHENQKPTAQLNSEDLYGEVDVNERKSGKNSVSSKEKVNWLDGNEFDYGENEEEQSNKQEKTEVKDDEKTDSDDPDDFIQFPKEEDFLSDRKTTTRTRPEVMITKFRPKQLVTTAGMQKVTEDEFDKDPVWRNMIDSKQKPDRGRQRERDPATLFPNAVTLPRKRSNILLSITARPLPQQPRANQGQQGQGNALPNGGIVLKKTNSAQYYVMMHSGIASRIHTEITSDLKYMPDDVPTEAYTFTAKYLPLDLRLRPSIGNGRIATVVHSPDVFLSGLYNGRLAESHRAAIPSTCSFNITETVPPTNVSRFYSLNVGAGIYFETFISSTYNLTYQVYAHRNLSNLMVVEVDLERSDTSSPLTLKVNLNRWTSSYDLTFRSLESGQAEVSYKVGTLKATETSSSPDVELHILYDHVPSELTASSKTPRTKWAFLTAYGTTKEEAYDAYEKGVSLIHGKDDLFASHVRAWGKLWSRGRIDIKGNLTLARATYGSWYYLLSSLPLRPDANFRGLSPSGLPLGYQDKDYQGHVMWDQELWMFPPVLLFHPTLSAIMLNSRNRLSSGAKFNAEQAKFTGLMFPWESGATGVELNSDSKRGASSPFVSAGIAFAIQQFLYATNASATIARQFGQLVTDIGHFLISTKLTCKDGSCSVNNVLPPDNSHGIVSNSPFVNDIIRNALNTVTLLWSGQNDTRLNHWNSFASEIVVPYDEATELHPAFDFYRKDSLIQEADAVLLGYPLLRSMFQIIRKNDLNYYESVLDPRTSPMTWAMHAIGWLEVGDRERASAAFQKQLWFIRNEFQVWSNRTAGAQFASNYLSGMGTFLQSLINGYAGIRLRSDRLDLDPSLPDEVTEMHFIGVDYLGSTLDLYIYADEAMIVITGRLQRATPLTLYVYEPEEVHTLDVQDQVRFRRRKASIFPANAPFPNIKKL